MEQAQLSVNQMRIFIIGTHDIVSHIYYHCKGILLAFAIILWMNFLPAKTSDTPPSESVLVKPLAVSSLKSSSVPFFVDWTLALENS